jgi:hypothetical protein
LDVCVGISDTSSNNNNNLAISIKNSSCGKCNSFHKDVQDCPSRSKSNDVDEAVKDSGALVGNVIKSGDTSTGITAGWPQQPGERKEAAVISTTARSAAQGSPS